MNLQNGKICEITGENSFENIKHQDLVIEHLPPITPVKWTSDLASRLLFSTLISNFYSAKSLADVNRAVIDMFLPVPNKDIAYVYAPCNCAKWSKIVKIVQYGPK